MPRNAAIYIADPSMLGSRLFSRIESIESYKGLSDGSTATGVYLSTGWGGATVNFMPSRETEQHLKGFSGYARRIVKDHDNLVYVLARIEHVNLVLGCVLEHRESDEAAAQEFLFELTGELNGLLFLYDSIFDFSGEALGGPATQAASAGA